jgi:hypothetical protein
MASLLPVQIGVTPVDGNLPYSSTGSIAIAPTLIPPGIQITLSLPPFWIQLQAAEAFELAAILTELAAAL